MPHTEQAMPFNFKSDLKRRASTVARYGRLFKAEPSGWHALNLNVAAKVATRQALLAIHFDVPECRCFGCKANRKAELIRSFSDDPPLLADLVDDLRRAA